MITREYDEADGIKIFDHEVAEDHADYNAKGLDNLYDAEEKHFWFIARKEFIFQNMQRFIHDKGDLIEIGAGTGNVARYLRENGYHNISVGEMHMNGLRYAKEYGIEKCYQFDLLKTPFEAEFDTVCLFDVLEHINEDNKALSSVYKMLKNEGSVVITVPAHGWLWNRDDRIAGHKRRYTKKVLTELLERSGFETVTARYFFISILPLLLLRRFVNGDDGSQIRKEEYSHDITINRFLNGVLLGISRLENKINRFIPNIMGGSILIIARKRDTV